MSDLSAQRLHEIMSPVWEVWLESRPKGLMWLTPRRAGEQRISLHEGRDLISEACWTINGDMCSVQQATALCIASMLKGLAKANATPSALVSIEGFSVGVCMNHAMINFPAPTLVKAFAAACLAVKGAAQETEA